MSVESDATKSEPVPEVHRSLLPGLFAVGLITVSATLLSLVVPAVGAPVIAVALGLGASVSFQHHKPLRPGLVFTTRYVLRAAVVALGFGLSLRQMVSIGVSSAPVLVGTLLAALATAWIAGRLLKLDGNITTLVGVGTAICGASAIAAANAVIDADEADVSYSIATIFTFNVVAVLAYPTFGHVLGLSQHSFGLWSGTAINDVSSVVAASTIYGRTATTYAVVVKLSRMLAILPICLGLAMLKERRAASPRATRRRLMGRLFPAFIVLFVAAAVFNTAGMVPPVLHREIHQLTAWLITAALGAVGLSADTRRLRASGLKPLFLGGILSLTVAVVSLALQVATSGL